MVRVGITIVGTWARRAWGGRPSRKIG